RRPRTGGMRSPQPPFVPGRFSGEPTRLLRRPLSVPLRDFLFESLQQLDAVDVRCGRTKLRSARRPFSEQIECACNIFILGKLGIFLAGRVDQLAQVHDRLVKSLAAVADLFVDLLPSLAVVLLAPKLLE